MSKDMKADLLAELELSLREGVAARLEPKALASKVFETMRSWDKRTDREARKEADPDGYSGGSVNLTWDKKANRFNVYNGKDFIGFMPYDNVMVMVEKLFTSLPDGFKMEDINLGDIMAPSAMPIDMNDLINPKGEGDTNE